MSIPGGSSQSFYLLNITDRNPEIWVDTNQGSVSLLSQRINNTTRPTYFWDLHSLAANYFGNPNFQNFTTVDPADPNWNAIWLKGYSDNTGNAVYDNLETVFTVAPFNHPISDKFIINGNISFSPLITDNITDVYGNPIVSETLLAQTGVYEYALFPAMPFLIGSSVPSYQHFGPLFADTISFSVNGTGGLQPVDISIDFSGGKCITTTPSPQLEPITVNGTNIPYRQATMLDCLVGFDTWTDINSMQSNLSNYFNLAGEAPDWINPLDNLNDPTYRIIGMKLNISQKVDLNITQPDTAGLGFTMEQGPRWASFSKRVVTGSVQFYTRTDVITQPISSPLTLYFGNPFFFPMDNVDWQRPEQAIKAGEGWLHTFNFIARAANNALVRGFGYDDLGTNPISEFAITTTGFGTSAPIGNGLNFYG